MEEIILPLKYLSNFWGTFEMALTDCEIILQLTCSKKSILAAVTAANQVPKFRIPRGGSRTAATSKMECFVIIVNGFQPLTIITKRSILDVAAVLDPPLIPDTRLHLPVVTVVTQYNIKLLKQLESIFKRMINWNKYHSKKIKLKTDI